MSQIQGWRGIKTIPGDLDSADLFGAALGHVADCILLDGVWRYSSGVEIDKTLITHWMPVTPKPGTASLGVSPNPISPIADQVATYFALPVDVVPGAPVADLDQRFIALEKSDCRKYLVADDLVNLAVIANKVWLGREFDGKRALDGLFLKSHWPEYGPAKAALLARINGSSGLPDTPTDRLVAALNLLASEIDSADGIANGVVAEAARCIGKMAGQIAVLRSALAGYVTTDNPRHLALIAASLKDEAISPEDRATTQAGIDALLATVPRKDAN